ncbi:isoprenyl transferase [bacterium F11]|nr:isoprenyl transferase [bacterium F11]
MSKEAEKLLKKIDKSRLPAHVAIIMDGNGRWAKKRRLPRIWGHQQGARSVRDIVEAAGELGIKVITLFAFSTENWSRPKREILGLMRILKQTLRREEPNLNKNNVRLEAIGDLSRLPQDVQDQFEETSIRLAKNTGIKLVLALNYGGRQDIVHACNAVLTKGISRITEEAITNHLYTAKFPEPDLLIRTSGEQRISNFLLWQIAYSEFHVTPVLWPEFRRKYLYEAILEYQKRERRYGGIEER